jgi:hypothetical protein
MEKDREILIENLIAMVQENVLRSKDKEELYSTIVSISAIVAMTYELLSDRTPLSTQQAIAVATNDWQAIWNVIYNTLNKRESE